MNKSVFVKHLKKKFDFDKFYESLTNKNSLGSTYNILDELHKNLGTDEYKTIYNDKIKSKNHKFTFSLKGHYGFSDKNYKVAVEDGTIFNFLSKKIDCKPIFIAKKNYLPADEKMERTLNAHFIYLFSFKGKEKKIIASMTWNASFGWEMGVDEIIEKKITKSEINKKVVKSIKQLDFAEYNYFFIYQSLNLSTNYFIKLLKTKLKNVKIYKEDLEYEEDEFGCIDLDTEETIRNVMVFQLNDNLRIPHISEFKWYKKQKRAHHAFHSSNINPKIKPPYIYQLPLAEGVTIKRQENLYEPEEAMYHKIIIKIYTYIGEIKAKIPHGKGKKIYSDGVVRVGEWKKGKENGRIEQSNKKEKDSMKWIGITKDGSRIKGMETYKDGYTYIGNYKNDKHHGKGFVSLQNGFKYEGSWLNGEKHGIGVQYEPEENFLYKGVFKHNKSIKVIKELKNYRWNDKSFVDIDKFKKDFKDFYKKNIKSILFYSYKTGFKK